MMIVESAVGTILPFVLLWSLCSCFLFPPRPLSFPGGYRFFTMRCIGRFDFGGALVWVGLSGDDSFLRCIHRMDTSTWRLFVSLKGVIVFQFFFDFRAGTRGIFHPFGMFFVSFEEHFVSMCFYFVYTDVSLVTASTFKRSDSGIALLTIFWYIF